MMSHSASHAATSVLLIEADLDAQARHEAVLDSAGYPVLARANLPELTDLKGVALILMDVASFHALRSVGAGRLPPIVVTAPDEKAGVTACLCGATSWVPLWSDNQYLLDEVEGALRSGL